MNRIVLITLAGYLGGLCIAMPGARFAPAASPEAGSLPDLHAVCPGAAAYAAQQKSQPISATSPETPPTHADLRDEIKAMAARDQEARLASIADRTNPSLQKSVATVDAENLVRLKAIIAEFGFPTLAMIGRDGMAGVWLLTQHADEAVEFQKEMLAILKSRSANDVRPQELALLEDRVLVHEGKPQRYGSQFTKKNGTFQPHPIEDPAHVDERRAQVSLMPLADYSCVIQHLYSSKK